MRKLLRDFQTQLRRLKLFRASHYANRLGVLTAYEVYSRVGDFVDEFRQHPLTFEMRHDMTIICPDCGKGVAHRNRCPNCGGASWVPAGLGGGVLYQQRIRRLIAEAAEPEVIDNVVPFYHATNG